MEPSGLGDHLSSATSWPEEELQAPKNQHAASGPERARDTRPNLRGPCRQAGLDSRGQPQRGLGPARASTPR
eukprot:7919532-Alexandrium_andersonii.AAC.1